MKRNSTLGVIRIITFIVILAGASGSIDLTVNAGRNNSSILLVALFTMWVLSPFIGLLIANAVSQRWANPIRLSFYGLALIITLVSLAGYSGKLSLSHTKHAFMFLVVPLISWLLIAIVILVSRKLPGKGADL